MQIRTDEKRCCGAGQCVLTAPKVFEQRDDGIVRLLNAAPPKELHAVVREAAGLCPNRAISLSE
jgi:ferredoxin